MNHTYIALKEDFIHYLEKGKGATLIFLPSFGITSYSYSLFGDILSKQYRVIIPDLQKGNSTSKKVSMSFEDYVLLFNEFVDKLNIRSFFLIGISFSGILAAKYAQKYPKKVKKLYLASTTLVPMSYPNKLKFILSYARVTLNNLFSFQGIKSNLLWYYDGIINLTKHYAQVMQDLTMATRLYDDKIIEMKVPTILIFAKKDEFIPEELSIEMKKIKNLDLKIIDNHHTWMFTEQERFIETIHTFFG
ncbi:MAG: alpha/beta hydrolase [archaeon]